MLDAEKTKKETAREQRIFRHGGNIYAPSPTGKWLDFSANINPMGMADEVADTIRAHIVDLVHYPEPNAVRLRQAIGKACGIPMEAVLPGNGASDLLYLLFEMIRPAHVLLPIPTFSEYERAALAARSRVRYFGLLPDMGFRPDMGKLLGACPATNVLVLCNPNNPTGVLLHREAVEMLAMAMKGRDQWLVVDESFLDFRADGTRESVLPLVMRYPHLLVLRSMTKFYALPGLRLGFLAAHPDTVRRLRRGRDIWAVNTLAQEAGITALGLPDYAEKSRALVKREGAFLHEAMERMGIGSLAPTVNFLLLDLHKTGCTAADLAERLRAHGILIRDCSNYPGLDAYYARIAVRTQKENQTLVQAMEEAIQC
ncbi:MAG: threonine-phosphate decarboxylase CobD [Selenomonadaceae bacterium]|nr:threonine-phosphate decarboxylase CobD [Selenomonadaceae bacterium]MDY2686418.1 threonine-phosphate decarboxylase CobD [Selenomonadaceae bacterium]